MAVHTPSGLGMYVHLPFCPSRCPYCDFYAEPFRPGVAGALLEALPHHLKSMAPLARGRALDSLYVGGGTPSMLPANSLSRLLQAARQAMGLLPGAEVSLEANPGSLSPGKLSRLRRAGFNRLSLGVQSLDDVMLIKLGRRHGAAAVSRAVAWAREAGFENLSLDLIYGLPGQNPRDAAGDVARALELEPNHISLYELTLGPETPFGQHYKKGAPPLPGEDELLAMEHKGRALLAAAGFQRYEVSNFARPGFECRHNQSTWRGGDYLALGPGAHGHLAGRRFAMASPAARYVKKLAAGQEPLAMDETLSGRQRALEVIMLGLRTREGVDLEYAARLWGAAAPQCWQDSLDKLVRRGWARLEDGRLIPSDAGLDMADSAATLFF